MDLQIPSYKRTIDSFIRTYLKSTLPSLSDINSWGPDGVKRLESFIVQGKCIRGSLVMQSAKMYGWSDESISVRVAAAVEILHSGLLIHDDIIDNDILRRNHASLFEQYNALQKSEKTQDIQFGKNMALCIGDLAFFLAFGCLNLPTTAELQHSILSIVSSEFAAVCIAQMQDVSFAGSREIPKPADVLSMYRFKTGQYTFSLPMVLGATLAGALKKDISILHRIGVETGILYQIKDDELNLFGNPEKSGKPVGSDIREGKKTIYMAQLYEMANSEDKITVQKSLYHPDKPSAAAKDIIELLKKYKIDHLLKEHMQHRALGAMDLINSLQVSEKFKSDLHAFVTFVYSRER